MWVLPSPQATVNSSENQTVKGHTEDEKRYDMDGGSLDSNQIQKECAATIAIRHSTSNLRIQNGCKLIWKYESFYIEQSELFASVGHSFLSFFP